MSVGFSDLVSVDGALNGTTAVTAVPAPSSGVRYHVRFLNVNNTDTANVTLTFRLNNSGTFRIIETMTLTPGQWWRFGTADEFIDLDSTTKSLELLLSGAPTTTQPVYVGSYAIYQ